MAYKEVIKTSYGQRLKNSVGGVGFGFILVIAATILLFWNEGRTVKRAKALKQAQKECVELGDISTINKDKDGKLVYATGIAHTDDTLSDSYFNIRINAMSIERTVEYYQWVQIENKKTKDKIGGSQETEITYTYEKAWVSSYLESGNYKEQGHDNMALTTSIENFKQTAQNVSFGAYTLPDFFISSVGKSEPLNPQLDPQQIADLNKQVVKVKNPEKGEESEKNYVTITNNVVYLGNDPGAPEIGDVRVTFTYKPNDSKISIVAQLNGSTFQEFKTKNEQTVSLIENGEVGMEEMFSDAKKANKTWGWILRFLGILLLYMGFRGIFDILVTLLKVLPFLSNIASLGTGLVSGVLAISWGLLIIAIAWLVYRPVIGIALLVLVGVLIWYLGKRSKEKKAAEKDSAPEAPAQQ